MVGAALVLAACGGKSASEAPGSSGTSGATDASAASGGSTAASAGGSDATTAGGSSTGGSDIGGTGGFETGGSGGGSNDCKGVACAPIPDSCKRIVQEPGACCPTCPDTGCDPCPDLTCDAGTHAETAPGDCCPTCQPDPPDACAQGQAAYMDLRASMLEKYGSSGCMNSSDCVTVVEDNACASTCGAILPASTAMFFESNIANAADACSTCPPIEPKPQCPAMTPGCVNGKCTAVHPTSE